MKYRLKKTVEKINETNSYIFEKVNKIDKPLAKPINRKEDLKVRNERGDITTNTTEIEDRRRLL